MRGMIALLTAGLLVAAPVPARAASEPPSWTHDGFGPGNTGYNPAEQKITAATLKDLRLVWRLTPRAGDPACEKQAVPVVADGLVIVFDGDGVAAADLRTGAWKWRRPGVLAGLTNRTLTISDGAVIAGGYRCANHREGGGFVALDLRTGAVRWTSAIPDLTQDVVVDHGTIVSFATLNSGYGTTGYRSSDGREIWYEPMSTTAVSAAGRILLTGRNLGGSSAVDAADGTVLWTVRTGWVALAADPAGSRFYAQGAAGELAALDAATGRTRWTVTDASGPVAADRTRVYVWRGGSVSAYRAEDGRRLWVRAGVAASRPIVAGGLVHLTGVVLDAATGGVVATSAYGTAEHHAVVVGGKVLRVKDYEVRAYAP